MYSVARLDVVLCCKEQSISEYQMSLILEASFRMHNRLLDIMFLFSNKLLLKCYRDKFQCY
jgi:hypothetical protein